MCPEAGEGVARRPAFSTSFSRPPRRVQAAHEAAVAVKKGDRRLRRKLERERLWADVR